MASEDIKRTTAEAALDFIEDGMVLGVGTGSTVNHFIEALPRVKAKLEATVASSEETARRLKALGLPVWDLNAVAQLDLYVDGADEINGDLEMIKGGGGALTREKILAAVARQFVCIADESKVVRVLGAHPLPIEVIQMARSHVGRAMAQLGGDPAYREGFVTDNGHIILDVHHLEMAQPIALEERINNITGVVANGLFAARPADRALIGSSAAGVEERRRWTAAP